MSPSPFTTLTKGVHLLHGRVGNRPLHLPLLVAEGRAILIDTGSAGDLESWILPAFQALGVAPQQLTFVANTHCDSDHQGGNAALRAAAPQALLMCGDADREQIESPEAIWKLRYDAYRRDHSHGYDESTRAQIFAACGSPQRVDLTLLGGERIFLAPDWELEVLHLPGHSRGHIGFWDKKHHILFGGDAIHGAVYLDIDGRPALCPTYLHIAEYRNTINRIASLGVETYIGCHWPVMRGREIAGFCLESAAFVDRTEAAIISAATAAGASGITLNELCQHLGPSLGSWPRPADHELGYAIAGHLTDLTNRGFLREHRTAAPFHYSPA